MLKKYGKPAHKKEFDQIVRDVRAIALPHIDKRARKIYLSKVAWLKDNKILRNEKQPLPHLLRKKKTTKSKNRSNFGRR